MMRSVSVYLVALVAISVALATAAFILVARSASQVYRSQINAQTLETAKNMSRAVDLELQRASGILTALSASQAAKNWDWRALDQQARATVPKGNAWIVVQDRSGQQLVNTKLPAGASLPKGSPPAAMWRELSERSSRACNLVEGVVEPQVTCLDMALNKAGPPKLAISMVFRPSAFSDIITREGTRSGHVASLIDRTGLVIWRNRRPGAFVGQRATGSMLEAIQRQTASGTAETTNLEGIRMLTAFDRSKLSGWTVVVGIPLAQIEAARSQALWKTTGVALAVLALGCLLAALLARRIGKAAKVLTETVRSFDRPAAVQKTGIAEFDQAAAAITAIGAARAEIDHRQKILIGELNHRVKNTLAIIQSLAHQTFRQDRPTPQALSAFEGRLSALAAAHNLLTQQSWQSASMNLLVRNCLSPFCSHERCAFAGPDLPLPPQSAVSLALALHELATNAAKYGALSNDVGTVEVLWRVDGDLLRLDWMERGGPAVEPPTHEGFGTKLIKRVLAAELRAEIVLRYEPDGLRCTLTCHLPAKQEPRRLLDGVHITSSLDRTERQAS